MGAYFMNSFDIFHQIDGEYTESLTYITPVYNFILDQIRGIILITPFPKTYFTGHTHKTTKSLGKISHK